MIVLRVCLGSDETTPGDSVLRMIAADVSNAGSGDSIVTLLRASLPFVSSVEPSKDARLTVHASCSSIHAKTKDDCDNP